MLWPPLTVVVSTETVSDLGSLTGAVASLKCRRRVSLRMVGSIRGGVRRSLTARLQLEQTRRSGLVIRWFRNGRRAIAQRIKLPWG